MASAEPSRRVEKVVGYRPLSEMGTEQRREFHEALLDADAFEDLPAASTRGAHGSGTGPRRGGTAQTRAVPAAPHVATEALAAGISIFELARVMGASVKTIDRHYGHLARDSEQAIRARLDAKGRTYWRRSGFRVRLRRVARTEIPANQVRERRDSNPRPPA
jgi:hypothetical protein